jgi:hypothetical protein
MTASAAPRPPADPPSSHEDDDYALTFTPAPSLTARHDGWTEQRQRRFILLLREMGVVDRAAKAAGCSGQSAYKLRNRPGAEDFAAAWDRALAEACDRAFDLALDRATNGYTVRAAFLPRQLHRHHHAPSRQPPRHGGAHRR